MSVGERFSSSNKKSSIGNMSFNLRNYNNRGKQTIENVRENSSDNVLDQVRYFNDNRNFTNLKDLFWNTIPLIHSKNGSDAGGNNNQTN